MQLHTSVTVASKQSVFLPACKGYRNGESRTIKQQHRLRPVVLRFFCCLLEDSVLRREMLVSPLIFNFQHVGQHGKKAEPKHKSEQESWHEETENGHDEIQTGVRVVATVIFDDYFLFGAESLTSPRFDSVTSVT